MYARPRELAHDFVLPALLFAALGAMNWAVRGNLGFGGGAGCVFAGVMWGTAWWYCARDRAREQSRRYASGWIVLALTIGMGIAGQRGWRQWSHFFVGELYTNFGKQEFVPISPAYGFVWLFIAGVPWAGLSACLVAWCGSQREMRIWDWLARIACGVVAGVLARGLFDRYPQYFLPLYSSLESRYQDFEANPDLRRVINDCGAALLHLGYYLGFLLFEVFRRDWKNVVLILTVGLINGAGWAVLQNWEWAPEVWKGSGFLWWRCWESTGGISIGVAYGVAYFLVNRRMSEEERALIAARRSVCGPNFEWLLIFSGLTAVAAAYVGNLVGPPGSIGIGETGAPVQLDAWGSVYFAVLLLSGAGYYFLNRGSASDDVHAKPRWTALVANVEIGAVCVVAALIVPLFAESELRQLLQLLLPAGLADESVRSPQLDAIRQIRLPYIAVVVAAGMVWSLVRRKAFDTERSRGTPNDGDPNLERMGVALGVLMGFGVSLLCGLNGWFGMYRGLRVIDTLWHIFGPVYLLCLLAILGWTMFRPRPWRLQADPHPGAGKVLWLVLIVQNVIAQVATGPYTDWTQFSFNIYYVLLFAITGVIVFHFQSMKMSVTNHALQPRLDQSQIGER